jgi:CHAD domain-containing protein
MFTCADIQQTHGRHFLCWLWRVQRELFTDVRWRLLHWLPGQDIPRLARQGGDIAMAFRLERRPIAKELRRLVRKELDAAIDGLDVGDANSIRIHDARKHIKKARAIVKLLRGPLGKSYARENARLRAAGQRLSGLRDAEAMLQTLEGLHARFVTVITPTIEKGIARVLRRHRREVQKQAHARARQALGLLKQSRATLPGRVEHAAGFRLVRRGLTRVYERSKSALADLTPVSGAAELHAWRRRVKEHWYHVRLFESRQPATQARVRRIKALQSSLGEDHNLALLGDRLLDHSERFGGVGTSALVLGCIQKRQRVLRRRALASGHQLFASKPEKMAVIVNRWRAEGS